MTMTPRQSLLLSLGVHVGLVLVLLVAGVLLVRRFTRPEPVEVDLLQTLAPGPETGDGADQEQPKPKPEKEKPKPELDPKIVERKVPREQVIDASKQIDLSNVPKVENERPTEYIPTPIDGGGNDSPSGGGSYEALIRSACYRNWTPPPLGALGRPLPRTEVEIVVERTGRILSSKIAVKSGNAEHDRTALEAARLSNPLPAFPPELTGAQKTFIIRFRIKED